MNVGSVPRPPRKPLAGAELNFDRTSLAARERSHLSRAAAWFCQFPLPKFTASILIGNPERAGVEMQSLKDTLAGLFGSAIGIGFMLCGTLGWAYSMWMAIKLGSFGMFFFGILGPFALVAGVLGLWSFFFGIPSWLA